ncbi:MAG: NusA N-terminal domain-containing protein [Bacillales bacterium]|nr:NusA N-terminal domain-containing protein [Bacillales bacterium]MDY6003357.1 NusA N-terminal domain-containing protein [Bacilli bacterium]
MFNPEQFIEALDEIESSYHISREAVIDALKESIKKTYIKQEKAADDAKVIVTITENPAVFEIKHIREVVNDDDEEDKSIQISLSDANKNSDGVVYQVGDEYVTTIDPEKLSRVAALAVRSFLKQKITEIQKQALYEQHRNNVGTLISGEVEKCDEKGVVVTINNASFSIARKDLIGHEMFPQRSFVQFYLSEVSNGDKGPSLKLSRSDEGFLKCVIDDEIPDVHSGLVVIKKIVRQAGVRSKVAVYSTSNLVDPISSCIGRSSNLLQNVYKRLGGFEKVNFVQYTDNFAAYAADALRPADVLKIGVDTYTTVKNGKEVTLKKVIAVIGNEEKDIKTAYGVKQANLRLASELIGCQIEITSENEFDPTFYEDVEFIDVKQLREEIKNQKSTRVIEQRADSIINKIPTPPVQGANVKFKPTQISDDYLNDEAEVKVEAKVEVAPQEVEVKEQETVKPVEEIPTPVETKVETPVEEEVETRVVKTTTTLESLEKMIETSKKKESFKGNTKKRPRKILDEEVETEEEKEESKVNQQRLDIYTEEEKAEFDDDNYDEFDDYEDDIDYEDYEDYYKED